MTAFSFTWNIAYEAAPAPTDAIRNGDDQIRDLKLGVRERLAVDHSWFGDSNDGAHLMATLLTQLSDPAQTSLGGKLYTKNVGGIVELFYRDNTGQIVQLTSNGSVA